MNMNRIFVIVGLTLIMASYQNCGEGFDSAKLSGLSNQSSESDPTDPPKPPNQPPPSGSRSVTLAWDRTMDNEDGTMASIRGYKIYIGTSSGEYSRTIGEDVVGDVTEYRVTGLTSGRTYYFAVAAVSDDGVESEKSPEITYRVP